MKKVKRLIAMAAASMLLCGFVCQAAAGSSEKTQSANHVHDYYYQSSACTGSTNLSQHSYLSGRLHKPSGEVEEIYATCTVVLFFYRDTYKCNKCEDKVYRNHDETRHMNCGQ